MENNVLSPVQDTRNFDTLKNGLDTPKLMTIEFTKSSGKFASVSSFHQNNLSCTTSPELPDSRNMIAETQGARQNVKTPPPPPPRWAKPNISQNQSNFTVTTTVTFNVNQGNVNTSQVKFKSILEILQSQKLLLTKFTQLIIINFFMMLIFYVIIFLYFLINIEFSM